MEKTKPDTSNAHHRVLDSLPVSYIKEFTDLIRDSSETILWAFESDGNETGVTAILPGVWTGKEVVPDVEIMGFVQQNSTTPYRKLFSESLPSHLKHIPDTGVLTIYRQYCTYIYEGSEFPFLEFITIPEVYSEPKKFMRQRNIRIGIPESHWKWRKVIIRSIQTMEKRRKDMEDEPTKPAAVPAKSVTGKGVSQETPEQDAPVKPAPPAQAALEEKHTNTMKPPFAGNKKSEEDTKDLADDDCIACKGTGISSTGKTCKPCRGLGKRPSSGTSQKKEKNDVKKDQQPEDKAEGTPDQQQGNEGDTEPGLSEQKSTETDEKVSSSETSATGEEGAEQGEDTKKSDTQKQETSDGEPSPSEEHKQVKAKSGKKRKRTQEQIRQDKIQEIEEMGYVVSSNKQLKDMGMYELLNSLEIKLNQSVDDIKEVYNQVKDMEGLIADPDPEEWEETKSLIERVLPEDPSQRMKLLGELMSR